MSIASKMIIAAALLTSSVAAKAQETLVSAYNSCVTDQFLIGQVFLGSQRALDQAEGKCGHFLDKAYNAAKAAGTQSGVDILEAPAKYQNQLERRLLSMFPETKARR